MNKNSQHMVLPPPRFFAESKSEATHDLCADAFPIQLLSRQLEKQWVYPWKMFGRRSFPFKMVTFQCLRLNIGGCITFCDSKCMIDRGKFNGAVMKVENEHDCQETPLNWIWCGYLPRISDNIANNINYQPTFGWYIFDEGILIKSRYVTKSKNTLLHSLLSWWLQKKNGVTLALDIHYGEGFCRIA